MEFYIIGRSQQFPSLFKKRLRLTFYQAKHENYAKSFINRLAYVLINKFVDNHQNHSVPVNPQDNAKRLQDSVRKLADLFLQFFNHLAAIIHNPKIFRQTTSD